MQTRLLRKGTYVHKSLVTLLSTIGDSTLHCDISRRGTVWILTVK